MRCKGRILYGLAYPFAKAIKAKAGLAHNRRGRNLCCGCLVCSGGVGKLRQGGRAGHWLAQVFKGGVQSLGSLGKKAYAHFFAAALFPQFQQQGRAGRGGVVGIAVYLPVYAKQCAHIGNIGIVPHKNDQ